METAKLIVTEVSDHPDPRLSEVMFAMSRTVGWVSQWNEMVFA